MRTVFSDLDGTLLDAGGELGAAARDAIAKLRSAGARLVLLTSKTEQELSSWLAETGAEMGAFENGAGVLGPAGRSLDPAAVPLARLAERLREMEHRGAGPLVPIGAMSDEDLRARTGLSSEAASRARERAWDLPFLAPGRSSAELRKALEGVRDVALVRGGVFWHLCGRHDKGTALDRLSAAYRLSRPFLGLGDALNDAPFLLRCDFVALVPSTTGVPRALKNLFPRGLLPLRTGGEGWAEAIGRLVPRRDA